MMKRFGFTLAEVLITLGIVGIVAALTIPALINKTNEMEYKNKLKKEISVFSQAILSIRADNDGDFVSALSAMSSSGASATDSKLWRDLLATKVKTIKTCDAGADSGQTYGTGGCFGTSYQYYLTTYDPMTQQGGIDTTIRYSGVTADGAAYSVYQWGNGNTCSVPHGSKTNTCGGLNIDVNGAQKPNKFGKDMFCLIITSTGLYPNDAYSDDCGGGAGNGYGTYCAYKVLMGIDY